VTDTDGEEILTSAQSKMANVMLKDSCIGQRYILIIVAIEKGNNDTFFTPSFQSRIHHPGGAPDRRRQATQRYNW
jgi:hypothetical protein